MKMVISEILWRPEWLPTLGRRALVAAISLNDPPRLRLFVTAVDVTTGDNLRAYFLARRAAATDGATAGGAGELAFLRRPSTFGSIRHPRARC